jgi:hypothetical protein
MSEPLKCYSQDGAKRMDSQYRTTYSDRHGVEATTIHNDGAKLTLTLRGVLFSGPEFDSLEPDPGSNSQLLSQFSLANGSLCECFIECEIPLPVVVDDRTVSGLVVVELKLGSQAAHGGLDEETLLLSLHLDEKVYRSAGKSGWFEDELLDLQATLPDGTYLKACINCGLSDYSPGGHGSFGCMLCFRDCKAEYRKVKNKSDLFKVIGALGKPILVQETFLCPEFERHKPGPSSHPKCRSSP